MIIHEVTHRNSMRQICCRINFLNVIFILCHWKISNLVLHTIFRILNFSNLLLNIVKRPLLTLLHLYHHLLNLFELLKAVGLHLFKLLLFRNKHIKTGFFVPKESVLYYFIIFLFFSEFNSTMYTLFPTLVEGVGW